MSCFSKIWAKISFFSRKISSQKEHENVLRSFSPNSCLNVVKGVESGSSFVFCLLAFVIFGRVVIRAFLGQLRTFCWPLLSDLELWYFAVCILRLVRVLWVDEQILHHELCRTNFSAMSLYNIILNCFKVLSRVLRNYVYRSTLCTTLYVLLMKSYLAGYVQWKYCNNVYINI